MIIHHYSDPGHSWFKVDKFWLDVVVGEHWRKMFSCYSYESDKAVFLEEDCDYPKLLKFIQMERKHIKIKYTEHQTNKRSRIRNYQPLAPI